MKTERMARLTGIVSLMLLSAAAGAWLPPIIAGQRAAGADVSCLQVAGRQVCKGQAIADLPWSANPSMGGIVSLSCDFERPGKTRENGHMFTLSDIARGCGSRQFVATFSNGNTLTNLWVADGRLLQIDQFNSRTLDL